MKAIIIPVHDTREAILGQLRHLAALPDCALAEVIVVDDGSTDGTATAIAAEFPAVTVLRGTGQLFWTGGIRLGMEHALARGAEFIVWLNHDCRPEPGALTKLLAVLQDRSVGCVAALRYLHGYRQTLLSPGFDDCYRLLMVAEDAGLTEMGGATGNCVAFRTDVVRRVGLPDARRFPHFGDGPYTLAVRRAGYRVLVHTGARAEQDHEMVRSLSVFWQVALLRPPPGGWVRYWYGSLKSSYEWRTAWHRMRFFRGRSAWLAYPARQALGLAIILAGTVLRLGCPRAWRIRWGLRRLPARVAREKLLGELATGR